MLKDFIKEKKSLSLSILLIIVLFSFGIYHVYENKKERSEFYDIYEEEIEEKEEKNEELNSLFKVDIKGAVKNPGVYSAQKGERVVDLITKAGGFTENADQNQVNLAQYVEDEMVIYVPQKGEISESITNSSFSTSANSSSNQGKININKANETELQTIPGIGPSKAKAIIEYREQNGPFQQIEDIQNVSGIGEKTFEKLKDFITVK